MFCRASYAEECLKGTYHAKSTFLVIKWFLLCTWSLSVQVEFSLICGHFLCPDQFSLFSMTFSVLICQGYKVPCLALNKQAQIEMI